jgi:hypothetical protein
VLGLITGTATLHQIISLFQTDFLHRKRTWFAIVKNTDENILYGQLFWAAHFKSYLFTNLWRLSAYIELATVMMWLARASFIRSNLY